MKNIQKIMYNPGPTLISIGAHAFELAGEPDDEL